MTFSTEDVKMVLSTISGYLIVLAVLLVVVIAVAVTVRKMDKLKKCLIRWQALFAWLLAVVVCVNTICFGVYGDTLNAALAEKRIFQKKQKKHLEIPCRRRRRKESFWQRMKIKCFLLQM